MGRTRTFLAELLRPWWVRVAFLITVAIPSYDSASNQFGWPKLPRLWGMTGSLLPWWGWLLLLQAILVAALFEYVRRNIPAANQESRGNGAAELGNDNELAARVRSIENRLVGRVSGYTDEAWLKNFNENLPKRIEEEFTRRLALRAKDDLTQRAVAEKVIADAKRQTAKEAIKALEGARMAINEERGSFYNAKRASLARTGALQALSALGVPADEVEEARKHRRDSIMVDAAYLRREGDEVSTWPTDKAKRDWHLLAADLQALENMLQSYLNDAEPDLAFLRKLSQIGK